MWKPHLNLQRYLALRQRHSGSGFTLLELLITILVLGVLTIVAYPNVLNQVGKARMAEAKNGLGSINRAQQAYLFENGQFATDLRELNVSFSLGSNQSSAYETQYFLFTIDGTPTANEVHHTAVPLESSAYNTKTVVSAVYHNPTHFNALICEAVSSTQLPQIIDANTCLNGRLVN